VHVRPQAKVASASRLPYMLPIGSVSAVEDGAVFRVHTAAASSTVKTCSLAPWRACLSLPVLARSLDLIYGRWRRTCPNAKQMPVVGGKGHELHVSYALW
jgi:hypothetical protein